MQNNIVDGFLNKTVLVETGLEQVKGKLIHYEPSDSQNHKPFTLILKAQEHFLVLRNWSIIKVK